MNLRTALLSIFIFISFDAQAGFWKTTAEEFVSPVTTDAKYIFYGGSLLTAALTIRPVKRAVGDKLQADTIDDKPLGKASKIGDLAGQMIPNAAYALTAYGLGKYYDNGGYNSKAVHMIKSSLYAVSLTTILKYTIREPRPNNRHRDSFPSGHTTSAFAFASVVGTEHEWYWTVPAYSLATFVGYSRINDNCHQLHDVVAGAVIGISYGLSIHYLDQKKENLITKINILPFDDGLFANFQTTF
jgi:membrane-associated phospholipid phosphatase